MCDLEGCMNLSKIDDRNVWWLWMRGVAGGSHLGIDFMYRLTR